MSEESDMLLTGKIVAAQSSELIGERAALRKGAVVDQMWEGRAEVVLHIPQWWRDELEKQ